MVAPTDPYEAFRHELATWQLAHVAENLRVQYRIKLTDDERNTFHRWLREFGCDDLIEAVEDACETKLCRIGDEVDPKSWKRVLRSIPHRVAADRRFKEMPFDRQLSYVQSTLRNRIGIADFQCVDALSSFVRAGVPIEKVQKLARRATDWENFKVSTGYAQAEIEERWIQDFESDIAPAPGRRRAEVALSDYGDVIEEVRASGDGSTVIGDHVALLISRRARSNWNASIAAVQSWIDQGLPSDEVEALAERASNWDELVNRAFDIVERP